MIMVCFAYVLNENPGALVYYLSKVRSHLTSLFEQQCLLLFYAEKTKWRFTVFVEWVTCHVNLQWYAVQSVQNGIMWMYTLFWFLYKSAWEMNIYTMYMLVQAVLKIY